ncbi:hypothetical protein BS78_02G192300 [Paspalum vaginatum]|nr:hypothetical protein BS78_02G192300 [Paspalum vaginatum]
MAGWSESEPPRRRPSRRNPAPPNPLHTFMEQTLRATQEPDQESPKTQPNRQRNPTNPSGQTHQDAILRRNRRRRSWNRRPGKGGGFDPERRGGQRRVKCARRERTEPPTIRGNSYCNNAKANPTAEAIKKRSRACGGGESAHAPIPIETNTQRNPEREEEGPKKNLAPRTRTETEAGLNGDDEHADQAGGAHYQRRPTSQPIAIPHRRGRNTGTVWARPGTRQDWIFDGCAQASPEILADFSSSDFRPACLPAHTTLVVITRISPLDVCLLVLVRFFPCAFLFSPFSSASLLLRARRRPEEKRGLKD